MIKHKKIIISILLAYVFFIVGIFNVHASEVITYNLGKSGSSNGDLVLWSGNWNNSSILNKNGTLMFSLLVQQVSGNNVKGINIRSGGAEYPCQLGTTSYTLGTDNMFLYSVSCPIMTTTTGVTLIYVATTSSSGWSYQSSQSMSFIIDPDISSIVAVNSSYTQQVINNKSNEIIQAIQNGTQAQQQTAQNTSDINNNIQDSSIDTSTSDRSTSSFSNTTNSSMSNTPVSNLITLPITFLSGVNSAISGQCTNVNYIELFGYQLVLPCLNLSERLGNVWTIIDTIFSCMLIFSIGKSLVGTFARLSDMDTNIMYECYANGSKHRGESFND